MVKAWRFGRLYEAAGDTDQCGEDGTRSLEALAMAIILFSDEKPLKDLKQGPKTTVGPSRLVAVCNPLPILSYCFPLSQDGAGKPPTTFIFQRGRAAGVRVSLNNCCLNSGRDLTWPVSEKASQGPIPTLVSTERLVVSPQGSQGQKEKETSPRILL